MDAKLRPQQLTTVTSSLLLERLKDASSPEWQAFIQRYRPPIVRYAQRMGVTGDDAEDAAQTALLEFCSSYQQGKYDRERGRLRAWLFGIVRLQVLDWLRRHHGSRQGSVGETTAAHVLAGLESRERMEEIWEEEWRAAVLRQCLEEVRGHFQASTFRAFELFALEGWAAERVAAELGITANAVFGAKRRVLQRVREVAPLLEEIW